MFALSISSPFHVNSLSTGPQIVVDWGRETAIEAIFLAIDYKSKTVLDSAYHAVGLWIPDSNC